MAPEPGVEKVGIHCNEGFTDGDLLNLVGSRVRIQF